MLICGGWLESDENARDEMTASSWVFGFAELCDSLNGSRAERIFEFFT